jgi:hypothetical protein
VAKTTREKITEAAGSAGSAVGPALSDARDRLAPVVEDAKERLGPALEDAKERLGPALEDAKDAIVAGVEEAKELIAPVAAEVVRAARDKGHGAAVKTGLAEEPKKTHKVRNLLIVLGIGAAVAFVYKKVAGRDSAPQWTAPRDPAPSAPLASEETVESPVPTTPDEPLEEKSV